MRSTFPQVCIHSMRNHVLNTLCCIERFQIESVYTNQRSTGIYKERRLAGLGIIREGFCIGGRRRAVASAAAARGNEYFRNVSEAVEVVPESED